MKKRAILSCIFTAVIVGISNQLWLQREPVIVSFKFVSPEQTTISAVLNKFDNNEFKHNNKTKKIVEKNSDIEIKIPVYKAKHPKRLQLILRQASEKGGGELSSLAVNGHEIDLSRFEAHSCDIKFSSNTLHIKNITNFSQIFFNETLNIYPKLIFNFNIFIILVILNYLLIYKLTSYLANFKSIDKISRIDILFLLSFFIILIIPSLKMNDYIYIPYERRKAAPFPEFINNNIINFKFGEDFNNWYSDRFMEREQVIYSYNEIRKILTYRIYNQGSLYFNKKNKWAFDPCWIENGHVEDFSPILANIKRLNEFCNKHNIKLYIMVAPVKPQIYLEATYPYKLKYNDSEEFEKLINTQVRSNLVTYPYEGIKNASKSDYTFSKGDPHWLEYGAFIGYQELMKNIKQDFPNLKTLNDSDFIKSRRKEVRTDFPGNIFYEGYEYATMHIDIKHLPTTYLTYEHKHSNLLDMKINEAYTTSESKFPEGNPQRMYVIGTSFSENLFLFLRYSFAEVKKVRFNGFNTPDVRTFSRFEKDVLKFKPDILLIVTQNGSVNRFDELYTEKK